MQGTFSYGIYSSKRNNLENFIWIETCLTNCEITREHYPKETELEAKDCFNKIEFA